MRGSRLAGNSGRTAALPEGARERFLKRIASSPASELQEKPAEVTPIDVKAKRRGAGFWVPWTAAAAMAIAAISLGVQNKALNDELNDESNLVKNLAAQASKAQQVLEVLTAPSAQRVTLTEGKAPAQPTARATYLPERGGLILLATNLKPLPEGKTYELWVNSGKWQGSRPCRALSPRRRGYGHASAAAAVFGDCSQGPRGDD